MTDGIVSVGVDPAVCVNVNGNFGVVCSGHQGMFCTNCRHSTSCNHVVCLNRQIEKEELIPELKDFVDLKALDHKPQHEKPLQAISKPIKFELTSSERNCFMKDYSKRFNIQNNIAHLIPPDTTPCTSCAAQDQWSMPYVHETTFLVTPMSCYKAQGTAHSSID